MPLVKVSARPSTGISRRCMALPLQPENLFSIAEVREQRRRRSLVEYRAALQREDAVGERQHEIEIVLDDHDRHVPAELVEHLEQFERHRRREALERLVKQQEAYIA